VAQREPFPRSAAGRYLAHGGVEMTHAFSSMGYVHYKATMTKLSVNTPIAISFELVANRLHLRNDGRIVRACVGPIVKSRARNSH
jgi:hypothetical protein